MALSTLLSEDNQSYPLSQLTAFLAEGCSYSCRFCWERQVPNISGKEKAFLPLEILFQAVREAKLLGLETINFTGADTLLHPQVDQLFDYLESETLGVSIETNGAGLTPEIAGRIARLSNCVVSIALDGSDAETHDTIHGMQGAFDTAVQAVRWLADAGIKAEMVFTVCRRNSAQLSPYLRLAEDLGAGFVRFNVPRPQTYDGLSNNSVDSGQVPGDGWQMDEMQVEELIAMGRRVEREMVPNTRLRLLFDQPPAFRGLQPQARIESQNRCGILNTINLLTTGEYAMCGIGQNFHEFVFGKVGEVLLEQVWNGSLILLHLRAGLPNRLAGVCGHCILKSACLGNCIAENYARHGTLWGPYWFCESAEKVGLFPASRLEENVW
jgi:SynChlorMet cassette radical SAM/SPASM protein ScmF